MAFPELTQIDMNFRRQARNSARDRARAKAIVHEQRSALLPAQAFSLAPSRARLLLSCGGLLCGSSAGGSGRSTRKPRRDRRNSLKRLNTPISKMLTTSSMSLHSGATGISTSDSISPAWPARTGRRHLTSSSDATIAASDPLLPSSANTPRKGRRTTRVVESGAQVRRQKSIHNQTGLLELSARRVGLMFQVKRLPGRHNEGSRDHNTFPARNGVSVDRPRHCSRATIGRTYRTNESQWLSSARKVHPAR